MHARLFKALQMLFLMVFWHFQESRMSVKERIMFINEQRKRAVNAASLFISWAG